MLNEKIFISGIVKSLLPDVKSIIMKTKFIVPLLALVLFSSCIVKALHPFYTPDKIVYNKDIIGTWVDSKKGKWEIISFRDEWEKETKTQTKITKEDRQAYERFKDAYVINYKKSENEGDFIAVPF